MTPVARLALISAAVVLAVGLLAAALVPSHVCPKGGEYLRYGAGMSACYTSDVGYAATSLIALKVLIGILAAVIAAGLAAPVMIHRRTGPT